MWRLLYFDYSRHLTYTEKKHSWHEFRALSLKRPSLQRLPPLGFLLRARRPLFFLWEREFLVIDLSPKPWKPYVRGQMSAMDDSRRGENMHASRRPSGRQRSGPFRGLLRIHFLCLGQKKKKKKAARYQNLSKSEVNGARPPELFFVGRSAAMQSSLKHMEMSADEAWAVDADGLSARPRSVTTCIC